MMLVAGGCADIFDIERVPAIVPPDAPPDGPSDPTQVVQLAIGGQHSCARLAGGAVYCWGHGLGATGGTDRLSATLVFEGAIHIAAGDGGTCAILADHTASCWGLNSSGMLANGTENPTPTPTAVIDSSGLPVTNIAAYAVGEAVACALTTDKTVRCAGEASLLGDGSMARRTTLREPVQFVTDAVALAAGNRHVCVLTESKIIWCWGQGDRGQLGPNVQGTSLTPVGIEGTYVGVSAGDTFTCGIKEDMTVACWGANEFGMRGDGTSGAQDPNPGTVVGLQNVTSIASGAGTNYATTSTGVAYAWGWNEYGQAGYGTTPAFTTVPLEINLVGVAMVGSGTGAHACALTNLGDMYCWGANDRAQLGTNDYVASPLPVRVLGLP
jgi:alpha-tubulin suppressor-like RCC1 family protein